MIPTMNLRQVAILGDGVYDNEAKLYRRQPTGYKLQQLWVSSDHPEGPREWRDVQIVTAQP